MTDPNRLIDAYLDGTLSKEDLGQLEHDLATNPKYADAFAAAMMIGELLGQRFEQESITKTMQMDDGSFLGEADLQHLQDDYDHAEADLVTILKLDAEPVKTPSFAESASAIAYGFKCLIRSKPTPFITSALAALLLIALWLINPFAGNPPADPGTELASPPTVEQKKPVLATLTAEHNAQWADRAFARGSELHAGDRLTLTAGFAEITTKRGAVAILEAPATIELLNNDNALRLASGKLVGLCHAESSKGFLIKTDYADITDIGTEFAVEAKPNGVDTTVFVGEVTLTTPDGATQPITTHQTARLIIENGRRTVSVEDQLAGGFKQRMPREPLIAEARINDPRFEAEVVPQGVYEDARIYSDRDYQINGIDHTGLPAALLGGDLVRMPADARLDITPGTEDLRVDVMLTRPCTIYMIAVPEQGSFDWIKQGFEATTMRVGQDRSGSKVLEQDPQELGVGPGNSIDQEYSVWKSKQPMSGRVSFGPSINISMYSIVAVPLEGSP